MNSQTTFAIGLVFLSSISTTSIADAADILTNSAQTPSTETRISLTLELKTKANHWGLDGREYQRYLDLMRGPLGIWNPDIDPLLALGMFAESTQQEQRYAELYAQQEFNLTERALQFQQAYRAAFERLYPSTAMLDQRLLSPYLAHQQQKSETREAKRLAQKRFVEGDRLLLFVPPNCRQCLPEINLLISLLSGTQQSGVDVYIRDSQDDEAVRVWAAAHGIKTEWLNDQLLSLNRDEGLLQRLMSQSTASPADAMPIFLKRNGRFFQLNRESLGL
ncbi:TIGR03759 family integrating conjugative element protein [Dasania sp. GY-19]|uniref:TIGR03759 family integrating conjugative element protein n=1 Tax=Dasania phycosphaerae TaxID=2950436 RepID=A0A9J6RR22_9GAMM|nr:TIGR03759 family integrating conjugative element protein [Dasania phycosphaerae]MCZ0866737.1 TIGR03759 family integrating conjugative element protein [Dasania phycosphaerae]